MTTNKHILELRPSLIAWRLLSKVQWVEERTKLYEYKLPKLMVKEAM